MKTQQEVIQYLSGAALGNAAAKMKRIRKLCLSSKANEAVELALQAAFLDGVSCLNDLMMMGNSVVNTDPVS